MERFAIEDDDIFIDKYIASPEVREHIRETGTQFTDFMKAAIIYHLGRDRGLTFDETRSDLERLRDTTEDAELRQQLSERMAYDDACLERHKCNEDGFYGLYLYIDGEIYYCRQCLSFNVAYRQGCRAGEKFRITKFRQVTAEGGKGQSLMPRLFWCSLGEGTWCINMANLYFDEHGELLYVDTFDADENEERAYGRQGRFEAAEIDIPSPFQAGDVVETLQSGTIGVVLSAGHTQTWRWSEEQCVYYKHEIGRFLYTKEEGFVYGPPLHINRIYVRLFGNRDGERQSYKTGRQGTCCIKHTITLAIPELDACCYFNANYIPELDACRFAIDNYRKNRMTREWEKEWWTRDSDKCTAEFAPYHLTYSELPEENFTLTSRCIINLLSWQAHHERVKELRDCKLSRDIYAFLTKAALVIIVILLIKILLFS